MTEVIKDFDWSKSGKTRRSKYPWAEWISGDTILATKNADYDCSTASFVSNLRWKARVERMSVRTASPDNGIEGIIFMFCKKDEDNE